MLVLKVEKDDINVSQYEHAKSVAHKHAEFADMLLFYFLFTNEVVAFARLQIKDVTVVKSSNDYNVIYRQSYQEVERAKNSKS